MIFDKGKQLWSPRQGILQKVGNMRRAARIITKVSPELLGQSDFGFARPDVRNSQIRIGLSRHVVDFVPAGLEDLQYIAYPPVNKRIAMETLPPSQVKTVKKTVDVQSL